MATLRRSVPLLPFSASVFHALAFYITVTAIYCALPSLCLSNTSPPERIVNGNITTSNEVPILDNGSPHNLATTTFAESSTRNSVNSTSSGEDDYDYYTDNVEAKRIRDNSKIAQLVVFFSVIIIALGGVMLKYFVTEYEKSQLKAQEQLNYQRLRNDQIA